MHYRIIIVSQTRYERSRVSQLVMQYNTIEAIVPCLQQKSIDRALQCLQTERNKI